MAHRLQNSIRPIVDIFLRPFGPHLPILLALTVLTALTNGFHWWRIGFSSYAVYTFCEQLITMYLLVALIGVLRGTAYKVCSSVLVVWSVIWCTIDTFCFTEMIAPFSEDFAASIKGTNRDETSEFIETFLSRRTLAYLCVVYALAWAVWWLARRMAWKAGRRLSGALACAMALLALPILRNSTCLKENPLYKTSLLLSHYEGVDMEKFNRTPRISVNDPDALTEEVIIVVGESFARNHSSLYGYGLPTNPRLQVLADDGRLVVFADARSARTYTIGSFVCFMSEGEGDGDDWQSRRLIPCVYDMAGYHTAWLSNQSKHGMVDNIVSSFAALCDTSVFIGNQFSGIDRQSYDGELLPYYHRMQAEDHDRGLSVIHLVGSHNTFAKRYPAEWGQFTADDYAGRPAHQRSTLAHYDNSILYNDYVVSEIMQGCGQRDALVFYFSDHGYDVYDTNDHYVGQGRETDPESHKRGLEIPMMVYITPEYEERHPERAAMLRQSAENAFCTDTLINILCRASGISL